MAKAFSWAAVILWMSLIFYLSHQPADESSELSRGVTEVVIETLEKVAPNAGLNINDFHNIIRKNAHFFIYLILGVLVINAMRRSNITLKRSAVTALLICILYAISDEVHQIFIPGRSGEVSDVIIDTAGASVGIGMYLLTRKIINLRKPQNMKKSLAS
ncbi:VanZ family protein [Evansella sp. LMS18]|uniref:VanZ family protein n=1 Tax=Evansella sp. LMS18 TaxID=2924033 RepID=UPI0020D06D91|nr:VanZ family protein [Evansella sp. LMS18]UTR12116.1 VanZ family protein [Evansella sp. LMS18]